MCRFQVLLAVKVGKVDVEATFNGFKEASRLDVEVSKDVVRVEAIAVSFPTTLHGIKDKASGQVLVDASFVDGTKYANLFSAKGDPALPGLVKFSSSHKDIASVDETKGRVTLHNNYHAMVGVTIQVPNSNVKKVVSFACNLDPDVTDMDLGMALGLPLPAPKVGGVFAVQLRVNSGSQFIGPFSVSIFYDKDSLEAVKGVKEGADLIKGGRAQSLLARQNDPPGVVEVVGVPNKKNQKGAHYHLFTIEFKVTKDTKKPTKIYGKVNKLVQPDVVAGTTNIGKPGREFVAGVVYTLVGARRRRAVSAIATEDAARVLLWGRGRPEPGAAEKFQKRNPEKFQWMYTRAHTPFPEDVAETAQRRRRGRRAERGRRNECTGGRESGDANGDCVFDIVDSAYTAEYVVETLVQFKGTFGGDFKKKMPDGTGKLNMDADRNGVINSYDAFYLAKAAVDMTRFVVTKSIKFIPAKINNGTADSGCIATLEAQILMGGDKPDKSKKDQQQTAVYFDLASSKKEFPALFKASIDDCDKCSGKLLKDIDHTGANKKVYGGMVQAARPVNLNNLRHAPFFQNGAKSGFEMCFDIGSQHLGCWGQNTSRIQNKEVYATLCLQGREWRGRKQGYLSRTIPNRHDQRRCW